MGERSKKIGEFGEDTVELFLDMVGWKSGNLIKGVELSCTKEKHLKLGQEKSTHGIDFLYTYLCPLVDGVLKNAVVSVKFTTGKYPNSTNAKFKNDFAELSDMLECFNHSDIKRNIIEGVNEYDDIDDIGILFWLSNVNDPDHDDDYISKIENIRIEDNPQIKSTVVIDNKRLKFILDSLMFIKAVFSEYTFDFFYPPTGKNLVSSKKQNYGDFLPIEYLNASILPIRIQNKDNPKEICLLLFSIDTYDKDDLKQLIGLAKDLTSSWASKSYICFPNYDDLNNEEEVKIIKSHFQDHKFTNTVFVLNYNKNYPKI